MEVNTKMSGEKHCYGCKFYKPYFTKGYTQFDRCDIGLCTKKKATVERHESCEKFMCMYYGRVNRMQAALSAIAEHINVLAEIKQIVEEDDEEAIGELLFQYKNRNK